jgi:hypothetical protein
MFLFKNVRRIEKYYIKKQLRRVRLVRLIVYINSKQVNIYF